MPRRTTGKTPAPRVLVVDDVDDNREIYAQFFEFSGFRVAEATDGEDALRKVSTEKPDVIVMDLSMPLLDGWETTQRLKADPRTVDIIVIVLTGHAMHEEVRKAKASGADAVLTKPCLPNDLFEKVRMLLGAKRKG